MVLVVKLLLGDTCAICRVTANADISTADVCS